MTASPPSFSIRPATDADEAALGRLGALMIEVHHALDPARFFPAAPDVAIPYGRFLSEQARRDDGFVLVAERDGAVAAYVHGALEDSRPQALRGPAGLIYDLIVDPEHRRSGLGGSLLDEAVARLFALGAPRIILSTAARNEAAQRLFAGRGLRPTMIEMSRDPD